MEDVKWKSEYNIGDFTIDKEHQNLFIIAQRALKMSQCPEASKDAEALKTILKELFSYVAVHFSHEESYMEKVNYPDIKKHKEIHKNLTKMLKDVIEEFSSLDTEEIKKKLTDFIYSYFIKHIITEDKKIQLYVTPIEELRKSFGWKDIYSVNESFIDQDHKKLFDIAAEAFTEVKEENKSKKIKEVLTELYNYMKEHFKKEEEYMEKISYPEANEHKEIHKEIIKKLNAFVKESTSMNLEIFEKELARIIDIALVQHIIQEDRKITSWVNQSK